LKPPQGVQAHLAKLLLREAGVSLAQVEHSHHINKLGKIRPKFARLFGDLVAIYLGSVVQYPRRNPIFEFSSLDVFLPMIKSILLTWFRKN